ncbi:hypothetical protein [Microbacterium sp. J1-1]|uniref:hypothetical protein n=1 Tax=Microbacterium sp. J1-1 TaxID=2992441 RepID=UPI002114D812|nr:hypothetical protein [Microbacterium sp. J1-1]UUE19333.1 hypothetical protein LRQ07_10980 [Microbacterium sp. J1-1]
MTPEEIHAEAIADQRAERIRATLLDAAGAALIVAGLALWSIPVALVVAGVAVLLIAHPIPIRRSR